MPSMNRLHHKGRIQQIPIYLGKFFRMFIFMDDWKVLPMAAMIAGLVSYVIRNKMYTDMEGTLKGALALSCVCIWNGFFNSIQVVCRERDIVKREHRSGMHISSYIFSHMVYQAFLCLLQTGVTLGVAYAIGVHFPKEGLIFPWYLLDLGITMYIITYAADMLALWISCIARTTTAAMTIMPFVLIFELVFSGAIFGVPKSVQPLTNLSLAKWGIDCICIQSDLNNLPVSTVWSQLQKVKDIEYKDTGKKPFEYIIKYMDEKDMGDEISMEIARLNANPKYDYTEDHVKNCWLLLLIFVGLEAICAVIALERIDKDKR